MPLQQVTTLIESRVKFGVCERCESSCCCWLRPSNCKLREQNALRLGKYRTPSIRSHKDLGGYSNLLPRLAPVRFLMAVCATGLKPDRSGSRLYYNIKFIVNAPTSWVYLKERTYRDPLLFQRIDAHGVGSIRIITFGLGFLDFGFLGHFFFSVSGVRLTEQLLPAETAEQSTRKRQSPHSVTWVLDITKKRYVSPPLPWEPSIVSIPAVTKMASPLLPFRFPSPRRRHAVGLALLIVGADDPGWGGIRMALHQRKRTAPSQAATSELDTCCVKSGEGVCSSRHQSVVGSGKPSSS